jgi:acyl-CoA dehydrogenase
MPWDFSTDPEFEHKLDWMRYFVRTEILPLETLDLDWSTYRRLIAPMQEEVKAQGLWAAHLEPELGGQGMGQVNLALMHEVLGASDFAPPVFGNQAPDSGNSELIALAPAAPDRGAAKRVLDDRGGHRIGPDPTTDRSRPRWR